MIALDRLGDAVGKEKDGGCGGGGGCVEEEKCNALIDREENDVGVVLFLARIEKCLFGRTVAERQRGSRRTHSLVEVYDRENFAAGTRRKRRRRSRRLFRCFVQMARSLERALARLLR